MWLLSRSLACRRRRNSRRRGRTWRWHWILIWEGTKKAPALGPSNAQWLDSVLFKPQGNHIRRQIRSPLPKKGWIDSYNAGVWRYPHQSASLGDFLQGPILLYLIFSPHHTPGPHTSMPEFSETIGQIISLHPPLKTRSALASKPSEERLR
jgi:hypothetical protein